MRAQMLFMAAALALGACQPVAEPESAETEAPASANTEAPASADTEATPSAISSSAELAGEYRLAGINGEDFNEPIGVAVSITSDRIDFVGSCVFTHWTYRFEGEQIVTQMEEGPTCRRALAPWETTARDALSAAQSVSRTPSNGILIDGPGGSLTLFSQ